MRGELCSDVGSLHVCWDRTRTDPACTRGVCVARATFPSVPISPMGFRCVDGGRCIARDQLASRFVCGADGTCRQRYPRLPTDGWWECVDMSGVVMCHGGRVSAGTVAGEADPGWICGPRRGAEGEQLCLDFSPDMPSSDADFQCLFEHEGGEQRVCRRRSTSPRPESKLADRCQATTDCPDGSECLRGHCLPPAPEPACWFDRDCGNGAVCRFGSCRAPP